MFRKLFSRNPYLRHYLNILFSLIRTLNLQKDLGIQNSNKLSKKRSNKNLLIAGTVALNPDTFTEYLISESYKETHNLFALKCDSFLNACFNCKKYLYDSKSLETNLAKNGPGIICRVCESRSDKYSHIYSSNQILISHYYNEEHAKRINVILNEINEVETIKNFKLNDINVGKHSYAATVRFFASPFIENEINGLEILKKYFESALKTYFSFNNLLNTFEFEIIIVNHGIYVPQGIISEIASSRNIKTLCFATGYRKNTFMVSYGKSYHFDFINNLNFIHKIKNYSKDKIQKYLHSRALGDQDWVLFHEKNDNNKDFYLKYFNKDKNNIILFTNVLWDADVHFDEHFFNNMLDWLIKTINFLIKYNDVNIIVRIHPGEIKGFVQSRVRLSELLVAKLDSSVLDKIVIIDSKTNANSYILAKYADHIILYGSKLAIELAGLGYRVLIGGPSWTLNKGITVDPITINEYYSKLIEIVEKRFHSINRVDFEKALKFAHYVFFDRCIEIPYIKKRNGDPPIKITNNNYNSDDTLNFKKFIDSEYFNSLRNEK
jgi:hypothetical protein